MLLEVSRTLDHRRSRIGFTLVELLVVLALLLILGFAWSPVVGRESTDSEDLVCVNNLRQIAFAAAAYASDNRDYLPHPTWGSIGGGAGAGPNGWAYATQNDGTFPEAPAWIPNLQGRAGPYAHTNQLPFYAMGQLGPYLDNQRTLMCPSDWSSSMESNPYQNWYAARSMKLTSYGMNGAACGYGGSRSLSGGLTYKLSAFPGTGLLLWGADETLPFNFNDAGVNPVNASEGVTRRHDRWAGVEGENGLGGSMAGRFNGSAGFVALRDLSALRSADRPNDLLCGPGYE